MIFACCASILQLFLFQAIAFYLQIEKKVQDVKLSAGAMHILKSRERSEPSHE